MDRRRIVFAVLGVVAFASISIARADQYGSDSAPIRITWQMQPTQSPKSSVPSVKEYYQSHIEAWVKAHPDVMLDVTVNSTDINARKPIIVVLPPMRGRAPLWRMKHTAR